MCVGLPLTSRQFPGREYSTAVFIVLNFVLFLLILIGQFLIIKAKALSSKGAVIHFSKEQAEKRFKEDVKIAKHLALVAFADFCCWFPIGVIGLMALDGHDISNSTYAWSAVLVMPINSAINPILYTVPILQKRFHELKLKWNSRRAITKTVSTSAGKNVGKSAGGNVRTLSGKPASTSAGGKVGTSAGKNVGTLSGKTTSASASQFSDEITQL